MSRKVPFLSVEDIERDAMSLIEEYRRTRIVTLEPPVPLEAIIEKHLKLRIEFDDLHARHNVARQADGSANILGAYYGDGSIFVDESLDPEENPTLEAPYRFTLAHELGHHLYHQSLCKESTATTVHDEGNYVQQRSFAHSMSDRERAEWQANRFSSCLLVPLNLLTLEWYNWKGSFQPFIFDDYKNDTRWLSHSYKRNTGTFQKIGAIPNDEMHDYAFDQVARVFARIFMVSVKMMRIRLVEVGFLKTSSGKPGDGQNSWCSRINEECYIWAAQDRINNHDRIAWR